MSDASLRGLEQRWLRGERSDELATELIVERLRRGLLRERRVRLAVSIGYAPAVATGLAPDDTLRVPSRGPRKDAAFLAISSAWNVLTSAERAGLAVVFAERIRPLWAAMRPGDEQLERAIRVGLRRSAGLATRAEVVDAGGETGFVRHDLDEDGVEQGPPIEPRERGLDIVARAVANGDASSASQEVLRVMSLDDRGARSEALYEREHAALSRFVAEFLCGLSSLPVWEGAPPPRAEPAWALDRPGWEDEAPSYLNERCEQGLAADDLLALAARLGQPSAVAWAATERVRRATWSNSFRDAPRVENLSTFEARRLLLLDDDPELRAVLARWTIEIVEQGVRWLHRTRPADGLALQRLVDTYRAHLRGEASLTALLETREATLASTENNYGSAHGDVRIAADWLTWGPRAWEPCRAMIQSAARRLAWDRVGRRPWPECRAFDQAARERQLQHLARLLTERPPAWAPGACLRPREGMFAARLRSRSEEVHLNELNPSRWGNGHEGFRRELDARLRLVSGTWLLTQEGPTPRVIERGSRFDLACGEVIVTWAHESLDQFLASDAG